MNSTHRRWLRAATATVGAVALTFGGVALPAAAADQAPESQAQQSDGINKYEVAAAAAGTSVSKLKKLEKAGVVFVSETGAIAYIDDAHKSSSLSRLALPKAPEGAPISGNPADGSRPDAPVTVYLDFDGEVLTKANWNIDSGHETLNFLPPSQVQDADAQAWIWASVAEDYAPYNVNVTTKKPAEEKLIKSSLDDAEYGSHVIITDTWGETYSLWNNAGGYAYFDAVGSHFLSGALVFTKGLSHDIKAIAEAASHESGHNFGLAHDGIEDSPFGAYYYPQEGLWAPIMGGSYGVPVTHWSKGEYKGYVNPEGAQDDLATIADRDAARQALGGFWTTSGDYTQQFCSDGDVNAPKPGDTFFEVVDNACSDVELEPIWITTDRADFMKDDAGDTQADAKALANTTGEFETAGLIETTGDLDVFKFTTNGGTVSATVDVVDVNPNLNAKLTLTNEAGDVLAEDAGDPTVVSTYEASGLGATVSADDLEPGTYFLTVDGVGFGDPQNDATPANAHGFTQYGSLGNYTLSGEASVYEAPIVPVEITAPADGSDVEGNSDVTVSGTATPGATVTLTVDGSTVGTATVDADGNWTATVNVAFGDTTIVATQTVKDEQQEATDSVTVTAAVTAPSILAPADGSTTEDTTPAISGTGIAGATLTVTITDATGNETVREVTVDADGSWSLTVDTELELGDYTVVAKQVIDEIESADSNSVAFTIQAADDNGDDDGNGDDNGNSDDDDDNLATTGSNFDAGIFALLGGAVIAIGGGTLLFARRRANQES